MSEIYFSCNAVPRPPFEPNGGLPKASFDDSDWNEVPHVTRGESRKRKAQKQQQKKAGFDSLLALANNGNNKHKKKMPSREEEEDDEEGNVSQGNNSQQQRPSSLSELIGMYHSIYTTICTLYTTAYYYGLYETTSLLGQCIIHAVVHYDECSLAAHVYDILCM